MLLDDYGSMITNAKRKAIKGEQLKILRPNQMSQRSPIALAEAQAGETSVNLLNEIHQIMCSL